MAVVTQPTSDEELQELADKFIDAIAVLTPYTRVTKEAKRRLVQLIKSRDTAIRIDELEASYGLTVEDYNDRIAELRRESTQAKEEE